MVRATGQSVQQGIAIGKILIREKRPIQIVPDKTESVDKEWEMFLYARKRAVNEVRKMEQMAKEKVGDKKAMIFSVYAMLLEEQDFEEAVRERIKVEHYNASYAVYQAGKEKEHFFANIPNNAYLNERSLDFRDIADRVIREIQHIRDEIVLPDEPVILVADDLTPAELVALDVTKILAIVLVHGSVNSHTSIIAKSMEIPMIVNTDMILSDVHDQRGIVDGVQGIFLIDPDQETVNRLTDAKNVYEAGQKELEQMIGKAAVTKSGRSIKVYANIGNVEDARRAGLYEAEGIGLFRSEFLYLNGTDFPSEETQFNHYRTVASIMKDKEVIIRTMDICADKQAEYVRLASEDNPAMGLRAIRFCFTRPEVFKTQLRAIYRASAYGNIGIMFPMITSEEEVDRILAILSDVKEELQSQNVQIGQLKVGIMIETPAAVLISDELAKKVDFFSIGTNDLTQYTLAMDRQNAELKEFQNIHHKAILKMIEMTVQNAHNNHIEVGICGELAADEELTDYFIRLGVDSLSVPPFEILPLRKHIRSLP
ncbi:MAG: phosphoenolpyruvate--protein phosphotransferase [Lachnospiraceae bacterium]|nr:phosphoenolpyruvate--protein phosphotransferase [Lachnospiraceae bacterium]